MINLIYSVYKEEMDEDIASSLACMAILNRNEYARG
jgi:hypothetical protein